MHLEPNPAARRTRTGWGRRAARIVKQPQAQPQRRRNAHPSLSTSPTTGNRPSYSASIYQRRNAHAHTSHAHARGVSTWIRPPLAAGFTLLCGVVAIGLSGTKHERKILGSVMTFVADLLLCFAMGNIPRFEVQAYMCCAASSQICSTPTARCRCGLLPAPWPIICLSLPYT